MLIPLTEKQKRDTQQSLRKAVKLAGSQHELAKIIHITPSGLSQLLRGRSLPSPRVCVLIEAKFGIKKEDIRPDIFMIN